MSVSRAVKFVKKCCVVWLHPLYRQLQADIVIIDHALISITLMAMLSPIVIVLTSVC